MARGKVKIEALWPRTLDVNIFSAEQTNLLASFRSSALNARRALGTRHTEFFFTLHSARGSHLS